MNSQDMNLYDHIELSSPMVSQGAVKDYLGWLSFVTPGSTDAGLGRRDGFRGGAQSIDALPRASDDRPTPPVLP